MKKSLGMEDDPRLIANTCNYLGYMWVDHDLQRRGRRRPHQTRLEIEPDNGAYLDSLGWYYYQDEPVRPGDWGNCTQAVEKTKPEDPTVYEHLGDTYLKLNDTAKAVGLLAKGDRTSTRRTRTSRVDQEDRRCESAAVSCPRTAEGRRRWTPLRRVPLREGGSALRSRRGTLASHASGTLETSLLATGAADLLQDEPRVVPRGIRAAEPGDVRASTPGKPSRRRQTPPRPPPRSARASAPRQPARLSTSNCALPSSCPGAIWLMIIGHRAAMVSCVVAPPALLMSR